MTSHLINGGLNDTAPGDSTSINGGNLDDLSGYWISVGWGDRKHSSSTTFFISGSAINHASAYVSLEVENIASTKHSPATDGGRNVDLGLYYIFVGGGWKHSTKDDRSSIIGGISNIVNGICACISEGSIGDSTSVSGQLKHSVDSKLGRSVTVSAGILSNDDRWLLSLRSNSSSLISGGVVTMVGV